jgi:hypothetical protein
MTFHVYTNPSRERCEEVVARCPENPFMTGSYLAARKALGGHAHLLALEDAGEVQAGCLAFERSGYLTRSLEIMSLPLLTQPDEFWNGLQAWCRGRGLSQLDVNTFASRDTHIPLLDGEENRRRRCEYVLDLQDETLWKQMSSNHARNIKRGRKAPVQIRRSSDSDACGLHASLMASSMMRRRERGEQVPAVMASQLAEVSALTAHGAGEIFQAVVDGQVLSSILVLLSRDAGYYHSAGTSAEGMACGASHVLVHDIAMALQAASKQQFNLGGVSEPGSGLDQFKRGFGSRRVELDAVHCSTAGRLTRWIGVGVSALRQVATAGSTR